MNCSVDSKKVHHHFRNQNFQKSTYWSLSDPPFPQYVTEVTERLHCCSRTSSNLKKLFPSTEKKAKNSTSSN